MKKGFTLIEIVVVLTMMAIILAAIMGALVSTFRASNKVTVTNKVMENGNWALSEIRRNIINSKSIDMQCPLSPGIGSSLAFTNINDGEVTTIICTPPSSGQKGKIASVSARGSVDLTSANEVSVVDCSQFVSCNTSDSSSVPIDANFNFKVSSGNPDASILEYVEKEFSSKISLRNK